jgi:hypothetical protein
LSIGTVRLFALQPVRVGLWRGRLFLVAFTGYFKLPGWRGGGAAEGRATAGGEVQFVPFYKIGDQGYTSYFTQT